MSWWLDARSSPMLASAIAAKPCSSFRSSLQGSQNVLHLYPPLPVTFQELLCRASPFTNKHERLVSH